jgi:hypothetical protein
MARTKSLSLHVVLDANCLYTDAADKLLNAAAEALITGTIGALDPEILWYLPQTVIAERKYQMRKQGTNLIRPVQKLERLLGHALA